MLQADIPFGVSQGDTGLLTFTARASPPSAGALGQRGRSLGPRTSSHNVTLIVPVIQSDLDKSYTKSVDLVSLSRQCLDLSVQWLASDPPCRASSFLMRAILGMSRASRCIDVRRALTQAVRLNSSYQNISIPFTFRQTDPSGLARIMFEIGFEQPQVRSRVAIRCLENKNDLSRAIS